MRIALITQGYTRAGGVQAVSRWLVDELSTLGEICVFDLAASSSDPLSSRLLRPGTLLRGPIMRPSDTEDRVWSVGCALAEFEFTRYLPRKVLTRSLMDFDVVLVVAGGPALGLAAARTRLPVLLQVATLMKLERESILPSQNVARRSWSKLMTQITTALERRALNHASLVFVENSDMFEIVSRLKADSGVILAPPGVDCDQFHPREAGWTPNGPIVAVGRLNEPRKGYARMLDAYATMNCPPRLVIIGRGDPSEIHELAIARGLADRVTVKPNLEAEAYASLLRSASVFWQTSFEEGLGIAVIEALASGIPVVATRTSGTTMSVDHGINGFLVEQNDNVSEQMIEFTKRIWRTDGEAMSIEARLTAQAKYSTEATIGLFRNHLSDAANAASRTP